ncbi:hypothetical protein DFH09DRAFT_1082445 [Mycena vulgaris]|nr:hypothetical protein DFH09DRAFT_1082445 [Mycena vulgaris]
MQLEAHNSKRDDPGHQQTWRCVALQSAARFLNQTKKNSFNGFKIKPNSKFHWFEQLIQDNYLQPDESQRRVYVDAAAGRISRKREGVEKRKTHSHSLVHSSVYVLNPLLNASRRRLRVPHTVEHGRLAPVKRALHVVGAGAEKKAIHTSLPARIGQICCGRTNSSPAHNTTPLPPTREPRRPVRQVRCASPRCAWKMPNPVILGLLKRTSREQWVEMFEMDVPRLRVLAFTGAGVLGRETGLTSAETVTRPRVNNCCMKESKTARKEAKEEEGASAARSATRTSADDEDVLAKI